VTADRPAAEIMFEEYLDAHQYEWQHEPDLGIPSAPDYAIRRNGTEVVCEVKQFRTQAIRELGEAAGGPVVVPPKLIYRTIRSQVDAAARQLKPLAGRGIPLVIVLANPDRATVLLDPATIFHAMYGGGHWAVPDKSQPSIDRWPIPSSAGRDGALTAKHAYISAVGALRSVRPLVSGRDEPVDLASGARYLEIVESVSTTAAVLPATVFDGAADARWAPDERGRYRQVAGLQRPDGVPEPEYVEGFARPADTEP
jgi:hypothetical protein